MQHSALANLFSTFCLSMVFVFILIKLAHRNLWFDHHDSRKIHDGQIPRLGGIGFASIYILAAVLISISDFGTVFGMRIAHVLIAMPLVLIFGVFDDFRPLRPLSKLLVQSAAALLVVSAGFTFDRLVFLPIGLDIQFRWIGYPLTFIWLVGLTNAVNLIDGVDGLAGGVSVIASLTFAAIFYEKGNPTRLFSA
jgi:UDP-GlcNAc:undecaprenyl-phosphate GlcNAc-1-phosphate transferase